MELPFTSEQFFDVFRRYNETVWPAQWALVALAILVVAAALRGRTDSRIAGGILAILWFWNGIVFHFWFFREINPAAVLFALLFVTQAALFLWFGVHDRRLELRARRVSAGIAGVLLVAYALVLYPSLSYAFGHRYPDTPTFGVPCPSTIFTLGLLLWATPQLPRSLLVIPVLWALIGTVAALQLGMFEDFGLTIAATITTAMLIARRRRSQLARVS